MASKKHSAKGTNGKGIAWKPGESNLLKNGRRPQGAGKGGKVKVHGTSTGYQRGCRCNPCRLAMSDWRKARRAAKKAEAAA